MSEDTREIKIASIDVDNTRVWELLEQSCRGNAFDRYWTTLGGRAQFMNHQPALTTTAITDDSSTITFTGTLVQDTHVTMAHRSQLSQQALRDEFGPQLGRTVSLKVTALLWSHRAAALAITVDGTTLDDGRFPLPACRNAFPHISVWFADGAEARESNDLPLLLKVNQAVRVDLEKHVPLEGSVSFWYEEQNDNDDNETR